MNKCNACGGGAKADVNKGIMMRPNVITAKLGNPGKYNFPSCCTPTSTDVKNVLTQLPR